MAKPTTDSYADSYADFSLISTKYSCSAQDRYFKGDPKWIDDARLALCYDHSNTQAQVLLGNLDSETYDPPTLLQPPKGSAGLPVVVYYQPPRHKIVYPLTSNEDGSYYQYPDGTPFYGSQREVKWVNPLTYVLIGELTNKGHNMASMYVFRWTSEFDSFTRSLYYRKQKETTTRRRFTCWSSMWSALRDTIPQRVTTGVESAIKSALLKIVW